MKLSDHIAATGEVPPTLARFGCPTGSPHEALAWLRENPGFDHADMGDLEVRLSTAGAALSSDPPPQGVRDLRPQQVRFRERVGRAYGWRCAITGCSQPECLEAAHLADWRQHNDARHGILMRADLHRLFDAGLMRIDGGYCVRMGATVTDPALRALDGVRIALPKRSGDWPAVE